jgi:hypothetical protein
MKTCKQVTIFEGPDGGGKSYAAKRYAEKTKALYVHLGPFPAVKNNQLGRLYAEAMLPALQGYQDVVLDRCWLSEQPYGAAYREGKFRLDRVQERMLARLAWRCGGLVIVCLPGFDVCVGNWAARRNEELLKNERQLRMVYDWYDSLMEDGGADLNGVVYDYKSRAEDGLYYDMEWPGLRPPCHPLHIRSAGNWKASIAIVGESFGPVKEADSLYQWPFGSMNGGASRWVTKSLHDAGIEEGSLLWLNADQIGADDESLRQHLRERDVIALGNNAGMALSMVGIGYVQVRNPDSWKTEPSTIAEIATVIKSFITNPRSKHNAS